MATQASSGLDGQTLELIRKQIFGNVPSASSLDYNAVFGNGNPGTLNGLLSSVQMSGNNGTGAPPGTNDATADSATVGNAVIGILGNVLSSIVATPIATLALNSTHTIPSTTNILSQAIAALSNTDSSINEAPAEDSDDSSISPDGTSTSGIAADGIASDGPVGTIGNDGNDGTSGNDGAVGSADGGVSGADGSADGSGGASGGSYALGGFVPGHDITGKDNINVNLSGGEFVVPTNVVDMLGHNFFEKLLLTTSPLQDAAEKEASKAGA